MLILIERDSATKVPKEVKDLDEAQAYAAQGFSVHVVGDDGTAKPLSAVLAEESGTEEEAAAKKA